MGGVSGAVQSGESGDGIGVLAGLLEAGGVAAGGLVQAGAVGGSAASALGNVASTAGFVSAGFVSAGLGVGDGLAHGDIGAGLSGIVGTALPFALQSLGVGTAEVASSATDDDDTQDLAAVQADSTGADPVVPVTEQDLPALPTADTVTTSTVSASAASVVATQAATTQAVVAGTSSALGSDAVTPDAPDGPGGSDAQQAGTEQAAQVQAQQRAGADASAVLHGMDEADASAASGSVMVAQASTGTVTDAPTGLLPASITGSAPDPLADAQVNLGSLGTISGLLGGTSGGDGTAFADPSSVTGNSGDTGISTSTHTVSTSASSYGSGATTGGDTSAGLGMMPGLSDADAGSDGTGLPPLALSGSGGSGATDATVPAAGLETGSANEITVTPPVSYDTDNQFVGMTIHYDDPINGDSIGVIKGLATDGSGVELTDGRFVGSALITQQSSDTAPAPAASPGVGLPSAAAAAVNTGALDTAAAGVADVGRFAAAAATGIATSVKDTAVGAWNVADAGDDYIYRAAVNGASDPLVVQVNTVVTNAANNAASAVTSAVQDPVGAAEAVAGAVEGKAESLYGNAQAAEAGGTLPEFLGGLTGDAAYQVATLPLAEIEGLGVTADLAREGEAVGGAGSILASAGDAATAGEAATAAAPQERHFSTIEAFNEAANTALPNKTYRFGTYSWTTDDLGRTIQASGIVELKSAGRAKTLQLRIGKEGETTDVGFHLIADSFNGPTNRLNVVPGNGKPLGDGLPNLNQGDFGRFENAVRSLAGSTGKPVEIEITPVYNSGNLTARPDMFIAKFRDVGQEEWVKQEFRNK